MDRDGRVRLTLKQRRFVEAYLANGGNGYQAAKTAGYEGTDESLRVTASQVLTSRNVVLALAERFAEEAEVLNAKDRQVFWSRIVNDTSGRHKVGDRLKASELLARSQGDFIERHEHSGPGGAPLGPAVTVQIDARTLDGLKPGDMAGLYATLDGRGDGREVAKVIRAAERRALKGGNGDGVRMVDVEAGDDDGGR